ncbi:MAG TPA: hypothetical protein VNW46_10440 [Gemmatimonadaceae bacterium]|jgi:hypothetical protein|nr:hypothetical protein [Gemmatimonadaceae bacterium]
MPGVTLQISLAPTDYPHARHILPHQLRQWATQVDEILLVVDLHRSRSGRFAAAWAERRPLLEQLVRDACAQYPHARTVDVDYAPAAAARVAATFFGGHRVPTKDLRGGPFYSYFFALDAAAHPLVIHADSDILFGGGAPDWVTDARTLLDADKNVLVCSPLPGPPTADGSLVTQRAERYPAPFLAYRFPHASTRIFALDRPRFAARIGALRPTRPNLRGRIRATLQRMPPYDLPENILSRAMLAHGLSRVDLLGRAPGMWSLHPPHRSALFYEQLPELITRVETGDIPDAQRGCYDINDSLVDWSSARAALAARPWWQRAARAIVGNPHLRPHETR